MQQLRSSVLGSVIRFGSVSLFKILKAKREITEGASSDLFLIGPSSSAPKLNIAEDYRGLPRMLLPCYF